MAFVFAFQGPNDDEATDAWVREHRVPNRIAAPSQPSVAFACGLEC